MIKIILISCFFAIVLSSPVELDLTDPAIEERLDMIAGILDMIGPISEFIKPMAEFLQPMLNALAPIIYCIPFVDNLITPFKGFLPFVIPTIQEKLYLDLSFLVDLVCAETIIGQFYAFIDSLGIQEFFTEVMGKIFGAVSALSAPGGR